MLWREIISGKPLAEFFMAVSRERVAVFVMEGNHIR